MLNKIVIITAVTLTFAGIYAFKNNEGLEGLSLTRESQEDKLSNLERENQTLTKSITKTRGENEILKNSLTEVYKKSAPRLKEEKPLKESIESAQTNLEKQQKLVSNAKDKLSKFGHIEEVAQKVQRLASNINDLEDKFSNAESKLSSLQSQSNKITTNLEKVAKRQEEVNSGITNPNLKASLLHVYHSSGFVIVSGGDAAGVMANSKLNVIRNGKVVAILLVTAVEPNRAAASIIRESLMEGIDLRSGDIVVAAQTPKAA